VGRLLSTILLGTSLLLAGCFYSFTGASVPPHLKTIAVPLFDDQSGSGVQNLREQLTNTLIDQFRQDNSLQVTDKDHSDSIIEGTVQTLIDQPQVVTSGETVSMRRVTLTVKVAFQDMKLRKQVWEKQISEWGDYESSGGLPERQAAITTAIGKVSEDIVLDTVSGW
jgi:outer membrane lipopolysaccharide assembly protein LptE/RlpB